MQKFIPFHIATIKNVSFTPEGQYTYLRLNFHTPGGNTLQFPQSDEINQLFVKELTLKTLNSKGGDKVFKNAFQAIKDLIKKEKTSE